MKIIEELRERPLGVAVGALTVVVGGALPWGGSGRRDRSSFEVVQFASRNGYLEGMAAAGRLWLLAPMVVAVVLVATGLRWTRTAMAAGTVLALSAVGLAIALERSPLVPRFGVRITMLGVGVVILDCAVRTALSLRARARSGSATNEERRLSTSEERR